MNIRPIENRIVVKPDARQSVTDGGVVLPQETRQPSCVGTVLAIGPGLLTLNGTRAPMQVRVGDRVTFGVHAGEYVDMQDTGRREDMVLIMRESDVQFVVESESVAA